MKAIVIARHGGPEVLELRICPHPSPAMVRCGCGSGRRP
jgi:hypothetical protein